MKALVLEEGGKFYYENRPDPVCGDDDIIVKIAAVCMCGSDVHAIKGTALNFAYPVVIGHEVSGVVEKTGKNVSEFKAGDKVCLMPCVSCGKCKACRDGRTNACAELKLYGVKKDGGLQEYMCTPAKYWIKIDFPAKPEEISMIEPLTIGAHALNMLNPKEGQHVLVIGAGPIGMSCAVNAHANGCSVTMAEAVEGRRTFGMANFPFEILDPFAENYMDTLLKITEGDLFDIVIDTTAVNPSMENAWKFLATGGKLLYVGIARKNMDFDERGFHMKEAQLYTTRNSTRADYEKVISLWKAGKIDPKKFITTTTSFEKAAEDLPIWVENPADVFKGVVLFDK